MSRAVIFVNGHIPDLELVRRLTRPGDTLLAADGGTRHALALGLTPSVVIGDLDSLTDDDRRKLDAAGTEIRRYPRDKNETDFELALHYAVEAGYREILLVAALGDRLDQTLGNLALLTDPSLVGLHVRVDDGVEQVYFARRGTQAQVEGSPGDLVSLIPWGGEVTGVVTDGLRWPLRGETLYPYKTRGISNELLGETASVSLKSGLLLVVHSRNRQS
ncbi:MAG: thiamine diphosphokinase [Candidatus Atribacteria bacterium]|nr:thiamine diphosphokinase [Candidatus Atribacteria bacterium]